MSLNHLPKDALATVSEMGWNEESVLIHLAAFVEEQELDDEFAAYCRAAAEEEDIEVDALADAETVFGEAGWDEDSQIVHYVGFIGDQDLEEELSTYLGKIADEEREMSGDMDGEDEG